MGVIAAAAGAGPLEAASRAGERPGAKPLRGAFMDWWMQYRGLGELQTLADKAGVSPALTNTYTTDDGRVAWLTVRAAA